MAWLTDRRPVAEGDDLVPVVVQDADDGTVLMLAWANERALRETERTGRAHFWSRSRDELWLKGATSGNHLDVVDMATDCDSDAVLYRVRATGPACHTGDRSCFEPGAQSAAAFDLSALSQLIESHWDADPGTSYTARLLHGGVRRPGEKVVEEAGEVLGAALGGSDEELRNEAADLLYHVLVVLAARHLTLAQVEETLAARRR